MTNTSRGIKALILNKEGMKEKISYERRDYEAVAHTSQSNNIEEKKSQILSPVVKG